MTESWADLTVMGTAPKATRERFSDDGEALMNVLRRQRVAHRTLVTVEGYVGKIERRNRDEIATLRAALDEARLWLMEDVDPDAVITAIDAALATALEP
jgi:hypothetical protein